MTFSVVSRTTILLLGVWFGLATGILEGILIFVAPHIGLDAKVSASLVELRVLWATIPLDLLLYSSAALIAAPLLVRFCRRPVVTAVGLFASLSFYTLLSVIGGIRERGMMCLALGLGVMMARWVARDPQKRAAQVRQSLVPLAGIAIFACLAVFVAQEVRGKIAQHRLPPAPVGSPNVLLIILDTLRADRLQPYGYARPTSQFLDTFARRSILFENAISSSAWTLPAHVSIFTGRPPHEHGAELSHYDGRFPTLAQALSKRGYMTVGIAANRGWVSCRSGVAAGFVHFDNVWSPMELIHRTVPFRKFRKFNRDFVRFPEALPYAAEYINSTFFKWLDRRPKRPFFAFLNYMDMHFPYRHPRNFNESFTVDMGPISLKEWETVMMDGRPRKDTVQRANAAYDDALTYLDQQLAALFRGLEDRGLADDLVVIITSDHGELFGEHRLWDHRNSLYRQEIQVPLMIRVPRKTADGLRVTEPAGTQQLAATIAELTGTEAIFPGPSLVSHWTGGTVQKNQFVLSELTGGPFRGVAPHMPIYQGWVKSLVTPQWHLITQQDGKVELYDWRADPAEERDLSGLLEYKNVVADLRARLKAMDSQ